jgi:polyisoprenoid-binding protein YceI
MRIRKFLAFILLSLCLAAPAQAAAYKVDADHSSVMFKIKHLFAKTAGAFGKFEGVIEYEPGKPETWKASGKIDVKSLDTRQAKRDEHLLGPDFFDAGKYPTIEFVTTGVKEATADKAVVEGLLTMHGVQKPVTLDVELLGVGQDPWGNTRAAFSAKTKIDRNDFGIKWNQPLNAGGALLGNDVEITLEIEAIQEKA